jgi:hypothetical protein
MANLDPLELTFRAYLRQRSKRYWPESIFLTALVHDDDFAALNSRDELDEYLARREVGPNGRLFAHTVWNSYLIAENLRMARLNAASALALAASSLDA